MITAWLFGSVAAVMWGSASLASALAARIAGPTRAFFWSSVIASIIGASLAFPTGLPEGPLEDWALVGGAGVCYAAGAAFFFLAVTGGNISIVTPITACDGAAAALLAAVSGAALAGGVWIALAAMVVGVVLVSRSPYAPGEADALKFAHGKARPVRQTAALAGLAAISFGGVYFLSGKAEGVEPLWVASISRAVPALLVLPLAVTKALGFPARARGWILLFGALDACGYAAYVTGAREDIAITAVAASQFGAVAVIGGVLFLSERLSRPQLAGVLTLVLGSGAVALQTV